MSAPGLEMGLLILEYVQEKGRAGFSELGRELNINKASLSRYLKVLLERQYVQKDTRGTYCPGPAVSTHEKERPWADLVAPHLDRISQETGCSALWVEFRRGRLCFIDRSIPEEGVAMQKPGRTGTAYLVNPAGYILLAAQEENNRKKLMDLAVYSQGQQKRLPPKNRADMWLDQTVKRQYFDDRGEIFHGIRRAALPLTYQDNLIGALVLGMIAQEVTDQSVQQCISLASSYTVIG